MGHRRSSAGSYPLIVGLISLISLGIFWNVGQGEVPLAAALGPQDGGVPDAAVPEDAGVPVPVLVWRLEGARQPTPSELATCLRAGGWDRVRVMGGGDRPLSLTHGPLSLPLVVGPGAEGLEVRSPLTGSRHLTLGLHGATAACVGVEATALVDAVTGRHVDRSTWPTASREAGLPLPLLVTVRSVSGGLATQGLERLGLFDVMLLGPDSPRGRRLLERAAVAALLADDPAAAVLNIGERAVPLSGADVPWWPAGADPRLRALGDGDAAYAPPEAPATEAPPPVTPRAPPTAPRRALPTTPLFKPDYR